MQRRYSSAIAPSSRSVEQAQFITVPCADGQAVKALQTLSPEFNHLDGHGEALASSFGIHRHFPGSAFQGNNDHRRIKISQAHVSTEC